MTNNQYAEEEYEVTCRAAQGVATLKDLHHLRYLESARIEAFARANGTRATHFLNPRFDPGFQFEEDGRTVTQALASIHSKPSRAHCWNLALLLVNHPTARELMRSCARAVHLGVGDGRQVTLLRAIGAPQETYGTEICDHLRRSASELDGQFRKHVDDFPQQVAGRTLVVASWILNQKKFNLNMECEVRNLLQIFPGELVFLTYENKTHPGFAQLIECLQNEGRIVAGQNEPLRKSSNHEIHMLQVSTKLERK